jgi:hypothetical protein
LKTEFEKKKRNRESEEHSTDKSFKRFAPMFNQTYSSNNKSSSQESFTQVFVIHPKREEGEEAKCVDEEIKVGNVESKMS